MTARRELPIDPADLRPGTAAIRRIVLVDARQGALVRRFESYWLHLGDLHAAQTAVGILADQTWPGGDLLNAQQMRGVVMTGALTAYFRCFDSSGRDCLTDSKVFKGQPAEATESQKHWRAIRHGHVAHDSNPWSEAQALIQVGSDGRSLGSYVHSLTGLTHAPPNLAHFSTLLQFVLDWTEETFTAVRAELDAVLAGLTATQIATMPDAVWTAPTAADASKRRPR